MAKEIQRGRRIEIDILYMRQFFKKKKPKEKVILLLYKMAKSILCLYPY